jgi:hypothetical protein
MGQPADEPVTFGNPKVNALIGHLKQRLGHGLDGSHRQNRTNCWNLIRKWEKDYPDQDCVAALKLVIDAGLQDPYHKQRLTEFGYLYRNSQKIANLIRGSLAKKGSVVDEYLARRREGAGPDPSEGNGP